MGKFSSGWIGGKDDDPDEKKNKLRELDQIRRNALGRKRELRNKDSISQKPKSSFMKTLSQFSSQRRNLEDATQIKTLINKPRIIKQEVFEPIDLRGLFRGGVKGRELTHPDPAAEKFKKAVLQNDAMQIFQSGGICLRSEENQRPFENKKSPLENDHSDLRKEVTNILNNSSDGSSLDLDNPRTIEFPSSPVIGRYRGGKKKTNHVKTTVDEVRKSMHSQENEFSIVNHVNKGERYRRRLFDESKVNVNNMHNEISNNVLCNNEESRNSTPENIIFYTELVSKQLVNKYNKKHHKIELTDPRLVKYYVQTCKIIGQNDLKDMFRNKYKDPEESAKEALKLTYKRVLKDYVYHQNCQQKSVDRTTASSNSEILLEPDSDIARRVKKNIAFQKQKETSITETSSTGSTKSSVNNNINGRKQYSSVVEAFDDHPLKRKRAPSSKGDRSEAEFPSSKGDRSEVGFPSSTQAIADPKSVRTDMKMDSIHPDRQELVARFLEDQKSFTSEASQNTEKHHVQKEKLYISDYSKGTYFVQKSTKYIPAILRKNRSLADCVAKEKATIMSIEKYPSQRNNKSSVLESDLQLENLESERTPNTIEQLIEAPKCKHVHLNAKYNQPSRINIPIVPDKRHQRNPVPERYSQRFPSPNNVQKSFTLSQTYNLSPIKQPPSFSNTNHDYHLCQLSQESSAQDSDQGITRMVSFGDIQERTDRLTLCSQNQMCSQQNVEHAYASQHSHHSYNYQPCEPSSSCNLSFKNQAHMSFAEPSNYDCASTLRCVERPTYIPKNEYQVIPQKDYSYHEPSTYNCCHQNPKEPMLNCVPPRQPIKFLAIEGSRRQPIYTTSESCSFVHKQPCCSSSSRADSSDFEYHEMLKMNSYGSSDHSQSFAPTNGNQRYIVQMQRSSSPPACQQVVYRRNHCNSNENFALNDAILHQINRQMHSKRQ